MNKLDVFKVDPYEETLTQIAKRIAFEEGVPVEVIASGKRGIDQRGASRDELAVKIIEVRERFCYEAYATGRFSLAQIGRWCRLGTSSRCTVLKRVYGFAKRRGLKMPRIVTKGRINRALRKVVFVDLSEVRCYG